MKWKTCEIIRVVMSSIKDIKQYRKIKPLHK